MALFNIPQFLDTEDKVVGPFTVKQLGWMAAAAGTLFLLYLLLSKTAMIILAIPILAIFGGLAFYKPEGRTLTSYVSSVVFFSLHPKMYIWKRLPDEIMSIKKSPPKKNAEAPEKKHLTADKIREISQLLDKGSGVSSENNAKIDGNITFK
ncbi:MAG TPA: PrgI family protein [Patescibacteria group bacterium]